MGKTSGDTALHVACFYGEADIVKVLAEGGADVNRENEVCLYTLSFYVSVMTIFSRWD